MLILLSSKVAKDFAFACILQRLLHYQAYLNSSFQSIELVTRVLLTRCIESGNFGLEHSWVYSQIKCKFPNTVVFIPHCTTVRILLSA